MDHTHHLVFVTGPSGAGRSTAINALEDLGYEAIDNMPLRLLGPLLEGALFDRPIALGIDTRRHDFSSSALIETLEHIALRDDITAEVLYLDCASNVLIKRFSETRRRHPLAPATTPADGIARDLDLLAPIRARADVLIDTSDMTPHDLRSEIGQWYQLSEARSLAISIHSFSYKRGVPRGIDMIFDVRFLKNPYWESELRNLDGRSAPVQSYIATDKRFDPFFRQVSDLTLLLLPAYLEEGKSHLSIGFGCTGGQHRSVALTETLANTLAEQGWQVSKRHRELERRGAVAGQTKLGK